MNILPILLKLAKETAQPVRLWMLYSLHISMEAAGAAFAPFMKDSLRLATAHLLADFFEAPLVLWVVSELSHSAAMILNDAECEGREEHLLSGIWKVLQQVHHVQHGSNAFATVRAESACLSTAPYLRRLVPANNLLNWQQRSFVGRRAAHRSVLFALVLRSLFVSLPTRVLICKACSLTARNFSNFWMHQRVRKLKHCKSSSWQCFERMALHSCQHGSWP